MPKLRLLRVAALASIAACSGAYSGGTPTYPPPGPPPPPPPPGGHSTTITVANNSFSPTPDTVPAGTVTFSWASNAITHNVTWDTGPGGVLPTDSGDKTANQSYNATVTAGSYTYHCTHHTGMSGMLVVQ
jgi:plastocyanin